MFPFFKSRSQSPAPGPSPVPATTPSQPSRSAATETAPTPPVSEDPVLQAIQKAHTAAMEAGEPMYTDPKTGYSVMTEAYLRQRGYCCKSGCRHCPFGFKLS